MSITAASGNGSAGLKARAEELKRQLDAGELKLLPIPELRRITVEFLDHVDKKPDATFETFKAHMTEKFAPNVSTRASTISLGVSLALTLLTAALMFFAPESAGNLAAASGLGAASAVITSAAFGKRESQDIDAARSGAKTKDRRVDQWTELMMAPPSNGVPLGQLATA